MKALIKTTAVVVATAGLSSVTPASAHLDPAASSLPSSQPSSAPFGLSFEDLRVGPTGKVAAEVGNVELPVRVAGDVKCVINSSCDGKKGK